MKIMTTKKRSFYGSLDCVEGNVLMSIQAAIFSLIQAKKLRATG